MEMTFTPNIPAVEFYGDVVLMPPLEGWIVDCSRYADRDAIHESLPLGYRVPLFWQDIRTLTIISHSLLGYFSTMTDLKERYGFITSILPDDCKKVEDWYCAHLCSSNVDHRFHHCQLSERSSNRTFRVLHPNPYARTSAAEK